MAQALALPRCPSAPAALPRAAAAKKAQALPASLEPLEHVLLVAPPAAAGGGAEWEPYRFRHHRDGTVSFARVAGRGPDGEYVTLQSERLLDADWRQPFATAPWRPFVLQGQGPQPGFEEFEGRWLYPFTLSYAPRKASREQSLGKALVQHRRTLTLAAAEERVRGRWLESLSQQARAPALRVAASAAAAGLSPELGKSGPRPRPRPVSLGSGHCGLLGPVALGAARRAGSREARRGRLSTGCAKIWEARTPLKVVRDLYDCYAADPIRGVPGTRGEAGAGAWSQKRERFLERYLERQREIEGLLQQRLWDSEAEAEAAAAEALSVASPSAGSPGAGSPLAAAGGGARAGAAEDAASAGGEVAATDAGSSVVSTGEPLFRVFAQTANATLSPDGVLSVRDWSGGLLLRPPSRRSFRLTVRIMKPLELHPIFLGVAPGDADLTSANFFRGRRSGTFLSLGGRASRDLISALHSEGAPTLYECGEEAMPDIPDLIPLRVGDMVSVDYWQEDGGGRAPPLGRVCFTFWAGGQKRCQLPSEQCLLPHELGWLPCALLSTPEGSLAIQELV